MMQHDPAWHRRRRLSIGASDVPVMLGLSPYANASQRALALEKRGMLPVPRPQPLTEGHRQEGPSLAWLAEQAGAAVDFQPDRDTFSTICTCGARALPGPSCPAGCERPVFMHANLDGRIEYRGVLANVEAKAVSWGNPDYNAWHDGGIPRSVRVQVQQQMLCSGLASTVIVVFDGPNLRRFLRIENARPDFQAWLRETCRTWWHRHVLDGDDPAGVWTPELLKARWPFDDDAPAVELTDDDAVVVAQWRDLGADITTAKKQRMYFETTIRARLQAARVGLLPDGGAVVRTPTDRLSYRKTWSARDE